MRHYTNVAMMLLHAGADFDLVSTETLSSIIKLGCCHSSVDSSMPTTLPPQVRVPSTPSTLLSFTVNFALYLSCEKNENKQKEAGFGPFKNIIKLNSVTHSLRQQTSLRIIVRKYKQPIVKISPRVNKYFWATFLIKMLPRTFKHHQIWSHCSTNALIKC